MSDIKGDVGIIYKGAKRVLEQKVFGRYTVIKALGGRYVECKCSCGNVKKVRADSLENGDSTSCGCYAVEQLKLKRKSSKMLGNVSDHQLYSVLLGMHSRCYNEGKGDFKHYGGKGVLVCERWHKDTMWYFDNFLADMEEGYRKGLEIERLDKDGNYCPDNCTWLNRRSQVNNTSQNRKLRGFGIELNVAEWGSLLEMSSKLIDDRINHCGWEAEMESLLKVQFRDKKHHLLYKGKEHTAKEVFALEGYTDGQRNNRCTKYGGMVEALRAEGVEFTVIKERGKDYLTFEEGLAKLRTKVKDDYEIHLLYKIEIQLKGDKDA